MLHSSLSPALGRGERAHEYFCPQCLRDPCSREDTLTFSPEQEGIKVAQGGWDGTQMWLSQVKVDFSGSSETL